MYIYHFITLHPIFKTFEIPKLRKVFKLKAKMEGIFFKFTILRVNHFVYNIILFYIVSILYG